MAGFRHEEEDLGKSYDSRLMARLLTYARPYWKPLLFCVLLLGIAAGLDLSRPKLLQYAIDTYLSNGVNSPAAQSGLLQIAGLLAVILVVQFIVTYGQVQLLQFTGQRIIYNIRKQVFGHLQTLDLKFFDSQPAGRIVTRVTNDTETLNELYTAVLVNLFRDVFVLVGAAAIMLTTNWRFGLVALALVPFIALFSNWFMSKARSAWRDVRTRLARINAFLAEHISGMKVVQLFVREEKTYQEFKEEHDYYFKASWAQLMVWAVFRPILDISVNVAICLVLWYGGGQALRTMAGAQSGNPVATAVTLGSVYLFVSLVRQFFEPLMQLAEKFNILQSAMASSERLFTLLDTKPSIVNQAEPTQLPCVAGHVKFQGVSFAYNNEDWVLRNVSFEAKPGQTIAFVGHTGAGKSSIVNLLTRFYDVQKGEVLIDGVNVKAMDQQALRRSVGLVAQDVFLFTGDIRSNIRLGNPAITDEQIEAAAKAVGADEFIRSLPQGYTAPVVERGATLSAGQRQLISFARALAFDPPILILDEATANIDSETEAQIQQALQTLTAGRTTFIVAHRLSTIQHADQIVVLHKGQIRERGTHAELLAQEGLYYKLWRLQFEEQQEKVAQAPIPAL
ncbi:MAG TPA: ABC transporter ATP-binding protein [Symbiobacteriaceae bacterium]|nr:ABC transporter ATP-binding protein [Symbiobacteriaceae bacterium]